MDFAVSAASGAQLNGTANADLLFGLATNNTISGAGGDDVIYGGAGNDILYGNAGNDALYGQAGSDALRGMDGDDRYVYQRGAGADTVFDIMTAATTAAADINAAAALNVKADGIVDAWVGGYNWSTASNSLVKLTNAGVDTLVLEGIGAGDLSFSWTGTVSENLVVNVGGGPAGDTITLLQHGVAASRIEKIALSGLGTMDFAVSAASGAQLNGTANADLLFGLATNNTISGAGGDDILVGGAGNDAMTGGAGSNAFVFRSGFGRDTISDFKAGLGVTDIIEFDSDLFANFNAVLAATAQSGANSVITLDGDNTLTLQNVAVSSLHADDFRFVA
jgi:Ca2+-binding RTX toxin-like protein